MSSGKKTSLIKLWLFLVVAPVFFLWIPLLCLGVGCFTESRLCLGMLVHWLFFPPGMVGSLGLDTHLFVENGGVFSAITSWGLGLDFAFWAAAGLVLWMAIYGITYRSLPLPRLGGKRPREPEKLGL